MTTGHLVGAADPKTLATSKPTSIALATEDLHLGVIEILQVMYETSLASTVDILPPGVHPSIPGHVSWQIWSCPESPIGSFSLALNRVGCRLGIKPRCFTTSAVTDNQEVANLFGQNWGYPVRTGSVRLLRGYDRIRGVVEVGDRCILDAELSDPTVFNGSSIRYPANLNLAQTPRGLRMIQADASYEFERIQRGDAVLHHFDPTEWDSGDLTPTWPLVATLAKVDTTLHEVRYLTAPDRLAEQGTEDLRADSIAAAGAASH